MLKFLHVAVISFAALFGMSNFAYANEAWEFDTSEEACASPRPDYLSLAGPGFRIHHFAARYTMGVPTKVISIWTNNTTPHQVRDMLWGGTNNYHPYTYTITGVDRDDKWSTGFFSGTWVLKCN